jgi:hypothetical protein
MAENHIIRIGEVVLKYSPTNEQEVVYLFGCFAASHGYLVERVQTEFPDAILVDRNGEKFQTEFEYMSANFITHGHDATKCNMVVCWWHNRELASHIHVIELCQHYKDLHQNPIYDGSDTKKNKTALALYIISNGLADKKELTKIFRLYHPKEQQIEPVRFIARLINNGANPFVDNGILKIQNPLNQEQINYSLRDKDESIVAAKDLLAKLGFNMSQTSNLIASLEE